MKSKRKLRVFEAFAGIGAQAAALKKDNIDVIYIGNCAPTKEYEGKELASWEYNINSEGKRLLCPFVSLYTHRHMM